MGVGRARVLGNFQCRDVLLILIIVWQGPTVFAVGAGECCFGYFFLSPIIPHSFKTA